MIKKGIETGRMIIRIFSVRNKSSVTKPKNCKRKRRKNLKGGKTNIKGTQEHTIDEKDYLGDYMISMNFKDRLLRLWHSIDPINTPNETGNSETNKTEIVQNI